MAGNGKRSKQRLIDAVIREYRASGNQDNAFEGLAARRLGVSETDLRCLNIVQNSGSLSAGELSVRSGLSAGAVTGVIDRLERAGLARRAPDLVDRRRVEVEVTATFDRKAELIWGPLAADWHATLARRFTMEELERIADFLRLTTEIGRRSVDRLRD